MHGIKIIPSHLVKDGTAELYNKVDAAQIPENKEPERNGWRTGKTVFRNPITGSPMPDYFDSPIPSAPVNDEPTFSGFGGGDFGGGGAGSSWDSGSSSSSDSGSSDSGSGD